MLLILLWLVMRSYFYQKQIIIKNDITFTTGVVFTTIFITCVVYFIKDLQQVTHKRFYYKFDIISTMMTGTMEINPKSMGVPKPQNRKLGTYQRFFLFLFYLILSFKNTVVTFAKKKKKRNSTVVLFEINFSCIRYRKC